MQYTYLIKKKIKKKKSTNAESVFAFKQPVLQRTLPPHAAPGWRGIESHVQPKVPVARHG